MPFVDEPGHAGREDPSLARSSTRNDQQRTTRMRHSIELRRVEAVEDGAAFGHGDHPTEHPRQPADMLAPGPDSPQFCEIRHVDSFMIPANVPIHEL